MKALERADVLQQQLALAPSALAPEVRPHGVSAKLPIRGFEAETLRPARTLGAGVAAAVLLIGGLGMALAGAVGGAVAWLAVGVAAVVSVLAAYAVSVWPRSLGVDLTPERLRIGRWSTALEDVSAVEVQEDRHPRARRLLLVVRVPAGEVQWRCDTDRAHVEWLRGIITLLAERSRSRPKVPVPGALEDLVMKATVDADGGKQASGAQGRSLRVTGAVDRSIRTRS